MATNLDLVNRALMELGNAKVLTDAELTAANTSPAKTMAAAYPTAISDVLSKFDYYSTRKVAKITSWTAAALNSIGASPDPDFSYLFNLPADYVKFRSLTLVDGTSVEHRIDGSQLYANQDALFLYYYTDIPIDTEFEYSFDLPADLAAFRRLTTSEGHRLDYRLEGSKFYANESPVFLHYTQKVDDVSLLPDYLFAPIVFYLASIVAKPLTGEMTERDRMMQYFEDAMRKAKTRASQEQAPQTLINPDNSRYLQAHNGYGNV